jgi:hypothetical protein
MMFKAVFVLASALLILASPAEAQNNCPLELMRPGPVGAAGSGHEKDNYIFRAYTGIAWSIRATVRCGDWREYVFSLKNAPQGMTVVPGPCRTLPCDAGTITWVKPAATASDIQLTVSDGDETATATWTINVSSCAPGAGGCCVIDATNGNDAGGSGTPAAPWQTLAKGLGSCGGRSVMFLRGAPATSTAYTLDGLTGRKRGYGETIDLRETTHPVIWIGWPGELPTIDIGYTDATSSRPAFEMRGQNIWLDNFKTINPYTITFSLIRERQYGVVARRLVMRGAGPGIDGANSAFLMFQRNDGAPTIADHVANNDFGDMNYGTGNSCVKMYSMHNPVIEDNTAAKIASRQSGYEGCFAIKNSIRQFTIRHNRCSDFPQEIPCFSGNMHATAGIQVSGEMHHNNVVLPRGAAYDFNQDGMAGPIQHWNNTFQGTVTARNIDTADGPFTFARDVMISGRGAGGPCPPGVTCDNVTDASRIRATGVLIGRADGTIIDRASGLLVEPYLSREGPASRQPKGHMLPSRPPQ